MKQPIRAILFGAGSRGAEAYGPYALLHPEQLKFIAVAEPDPARRERFAAAHCVPPEMQFSSWEEIAALDKFADVVFNCTQDGMHYESAVPMLRKGYDMLLEKPMSNHLESSIRLVQLAEENGCLLQICHVMRYTEFFQKIKEIFDSGVLGQILSISHRENVSAWHMAHSYVRGNWRSEALSSPMILAKCCHDLDMLTWVVGKPVKTLNSFGSLTHYRPENAPAGAPPRCTDGCPVEDTCPWYAPNIYLNIPYIKDALRHSKSALYRIAGNLAKKQPRMLDALAYLYPPLTELSKYDQWPRSVISDDPANEDALLEALRTGPYGRCVYHCDNDVVDHQVVSMEFEGGITTTLTMHGHSYEEGRTMRVDGSNATLLAKFSYNTSYIELYDHRRFERTRFEFLNEIEAGGHGGGDLRLVESFVRTLNGEQPSQSSARESLESHILAFAAEKARKESILIEMETFRREAEANAKLWALPPNSLTPKETRP
ncbi:MAG: Gfo/Idh/MocA family oxidoreductase [Anaerolineaceae bacterium]|nr:Gfo/Idh/MocA family oxidoreductase [Anaerolineaceae bacterium]